jgi:hypothetical protein
MLLIPINFVRLLLLAYIGYINADRREGMAFSVVAGSRSIFGGNPPHLKRAQGAAVMVSRAHHPKHSLWPSNNDHISGTFGMLLQCNLGPGYRVRSCPATIQAASSNSGQPTPFQAKSAAELLQLLRMQKTTDSRSSALQKIAGYVAPPADMESFRINWVGNVDTHQRKLFWGLIEMLCERLTVPLLIMMGVHNTIRTAQRSYQASARVLLSAASCAVATASVAGFVILQQWTIVAAGWARLPAMSKAAASCTSMVAGLTTTESARLLADTARSLAALSAAVATATINVGRASLRELLRRRQVAAASAAAAAAAASRGVARRHPSKASARTRPAGTTPAGHRSPLEPSTAAASDAAASAAAAPSAPLDAVAAERRRRRLNGCGRVRVRGSAVPGSAGGGAVSGCVAAARRAWEAVRSTDVLLAL